MTNPGPARARELWRLLEPIHAVTYFSPEPVGALKEAGYRGFWMGYFAGRAAPLGAASAALVHATFYNFSVEHVARAVPDAWRFGSPEAALAARSEGSVAALRRLLGDLADGPEVERAAALAARAAADAPLGARPLYAANRALPVPDEPLALLWHAATLLREHRGDGHVAALACAGITGREGHVVHSLATGTPAQVYALARSLGSDEWNAILGDLRDRGLVDPGEAGGPGGPGGPGGSLSDLGRETKRHVEEVTDTLAATAYRTLSDAEAVELVAALRPLTAAVVVAGEIPTRSPMGLDLTDLGAPPEDGA